MKPRAVFDCMVFLQAVANGAGPAFACLRLVEEGQLALYLDREILVEIRDVLGRQRIRKKFPHLTNELVERFLEDVAAMGVVLEEVPREYIYPRDPDDEPYINLAIAAGARYLVSRDKDLLDLMADSAFRARYPTLSILDPPALLREVAGHEPGQSSRT